MLSAPTRYSALCRYPPLGVFVSLSANNAEQPKPLTREEALVVAASLRMLHDQLNAQTDELERKRLNDEQRREQSNRAT